MRIICISAALCLLAGCRDSTSPRSPLRVELELQPATVHFTEPVGLVLHVSNPSPDTVRFALDDVGPLWNVIVTNARGQVIWQRTSQPFLYDFDKSLILAGGRDTSFTDLWVPGEAAPAGTYTLRGQLLGLGNAGIDSPTAQLTVVP